MVDSFLEEIDELFARKLTKLSIKERRRRDAIPTDVISLDQLKVKMIEGVEDSNLTPDQKFHTIDNIKAYDYELPTALWERSKQFQPIRISRLTYEFMPEVYERREEESRRVKTIVKKGRFTEVLSRFEKPVSRREVSGQVADIFKLSPNTISRDISPLFKAGYLTRISFGTYQLTGLGKEILEDL